MAYKTRSSRSSKEIISLRWRLTTDKTSIDKDFSAYSYQKQLNSIFSFKENENDLISYTRSQLLLYYNKSRFINAINLAFKNRQNFILFVILSIYSNLFFISTILHITLLWNTYIFKYVIHFFCKWLQIMTSNVTRSQINFKLICIEIKSSLICLCKI